MIDLLREQLYHQQMCIARDVSFYEEDEDDNQSVSQSAVSGLTGCSADGTWMSDMSSQIVDLKTSVEKSHANQKQELKDRIAEVRIRNLVLFKIYHITCSLVIVSTQFLQPSFLVLQLG